MGRSPFRAIAATLAAMLLVAACGDDDTTTATDDSATTETTETTSTESQPTETTTSPVESSEPTETGGDDGVEGTVIEVSVADGEVEGGGRTAVALGDTVTIQVTSDITDEIHVHGYDVSGDVDAGGTATVTFTADIPGVFEVELESAAIPLLELEVS